MPPIATADQFWALLAESRLMSAAQCERARSAAWRRLGGRDAEPLEAARQLVAKGLLTKYQAKVLLSGRPGPFLTGGYKVLGPIQHGRLKRLLRATHLSTGHPVLLHVASSEQLRRPAAYGPAPMHRHIARRYETFHIAATNYAAFENLGGFSAAELLELRRLSPEDAAFYAYQAALGLSAWHEQLGPFGDLGLKNVFVCENDRVVLLPPPLTKRLRDPGEKASRDQDLADWGRLFATLLLGRERVTGRTRDDLLAAAREEKIAEPALDALDATLPAPGLRCGLAASQIAENLEPLVKARLGALESSDAAATALAYEDWVARHPRHASFDRPAGSPPVHRASPDPTAPQPRKASSRKPSSRTPAARQGSLRRWGPTAAVAAAGLLVVFGVWAMRFLPNRSPEATPPEIRESEVSLPDASPTPALVELVDDDGVTLWAPPSAPASVDLRGVAPGAAWLIRLRPSQLILDSDAANPGGAALQELIAALGWDPLAQLDSLGVDAALLDSTVLGIHLGVDDAVQWSYLLQGPRAAFAALPEGEPREHASREYLMRGSLAWLTEEPTEGNGVTVVVASELLLREVIDAELEPVLRREVEELTSHWDAAATLQCAGSPRVLFSAGRAALSGPFDELRFRLQRVVRDLDGEKVNAVSLAYYSAEESDFIELRAAPTTGVRPELLAARITQELAASVEGAAAAANSPAGARYAAFPLVLEAALGYVRSGVEDDQAVLRAYLPPGATARLLDGAVRLAIAGEAADVQSDVAQASPPAVRLTLEQRLERPVTLSFPRDSLVAGLEQLAELIQAPIEIAGGDLKLIGVTQNQQMTIDVVDQPARKVLLEMLSKADPSGRLVAAIQGEGEESRLVVTTRDAAVQRGESYFPDPDAAN